MRNMLYAVIAASLAMFATSGIVALATAAPSSTPAPQADPQSAVDAELESYLDQMIQQQVAAVRERLRLEQR